MTLSKSLNQLFLFLLALALLSSCTKEDISTTEDFNQENVLNNTQDLDDDDDDDQNDDDDDDDDEHDCEDDDIYELADCVDIIFPITIILPDTSEVTIMDDDELEDLLYDWYDDNPESEEEPTLKYPITIIDEDGTESTINSEEELLMAVIECEINDIWEDLVANDCFTVSLPISFVLEDGSSNTVSSLEETLAILLPYYTANPEAEEPDLVFPIEVTKADGTMMSIADYDALEELEDSCED